MNFGENVRRLRVSMGLSQEELARNLGKKKDVIYKIENNRTEVSLKEAEKISIILGTSIEELLNCEIDEIKLKKKYELNRFKINNIHPNLNAEYKELPNEFKNLFKAVAVEVFNKFSGATIDKLINNIITNIILEYKKIIEQSAFNENCPNEVNKVIIASAEKLLSNHKVS